MPRSHRHGLMVSITPKRGLHVYFQKKASRFNACIGEALRHGHGSRESIKSAFKSAVNKCK